MTRTWKEFNIYTLDKQLEDLGIPDKEIESKLTVDLNQINAFNETIFHHTQETGTSIYLESGEFFHIRMKYNEFKKLICP